MLKMNKCLLILFFSIFLCTGEADRAQELLMELDLEEIVDKLEEFDVNQDGQLTEMEVELQQPGIQKYLDRYDELMKAEQNDDEDEEEESEKEQTKNAQKDLKKEQTEKQQETNSGSSKKAQQQKDNVQKDQAAQKKTVASQPASTETQHKQKTDTKTKPPAVYDEDDGVEIEVVEEFEFVEDDVPEDYSWMRIPAVVAGMAGMLTLFYFFWSRANAERQARRRQEEGQLIVEDSQ